MGGLYNMLAGWDQDCVWLAPMLTDENPQSFFPRFRDCWLGSDGDTIEIFTRVGGGNREDYECEIEALRDMPTYQLDYDDDFDCTYATFVFGVPEEWRKDFEHVKNGEFDKLSEAYVDRMQKCYERLDIKAMLSKAMEKKD